VLSLFVRNCRAELQFSFGRDVPPVKLRRPSLTVGDKDHDESERPQLASGNSLLSMNRQTEHGYKRPTLVAPLDKKGHAHFFILNLD
jgi:hypothetical protein